MASRRRNQGADAFGDGQDYSLAQVDSALFGGLRTADRDKTVVRPVSLDEITIDPSIQVRVGKLDLSRVETLRSVLVNGGDLKEPIVLCRDDDGVLWLADGFHRVEAYRQAPTDPAIVSGEVELKPLRAEIRPGGYDAAFEYAEDANLAHGEPLSRDDLKNILWRRLNPERNHPWRTVSNRAIAQVLGVTHPTVKLWKDEFFRTGGKNLPLREKQAKHVVTSDGKTQRVDRIVKSNKKRSKRTASDKQLRKNILKHLQLAVDDLEQLGRVDKADELWNWGRGLESNWGEK